ncbi:MAG TPA: Xaa-Pro peptidase family protein [Solirubrobacteraceae bacterium]|nr:Xaa-Pro peptidase family protein [Solirubrobacteraceae bacterium]
MSDRAQRAIGLLPEAGVDALLVTNLVNVRYLTGYTGSNGVAVIGASVCTFVTDFRYVEQAAEEVDAAFDRRRGERDLLEAVEELLPSGPIRLGFEEAHMSVRQHRRLRSLLPERVELVGVEGLIERLRAVKDAAEVASMRSAATLADDALRWLLDRGLVGRTERELALELEQRIRSLGAEDPSFPAIVAAGAHGALPHASPRNVEISRGELVVIDWGARVDGYNSDCTRTVAAGAPGGEAASLYEVVLEAQLAGVGAVMPGGVGRDVDGAARAVIEAAGHGDRFGHGLGHGVGLEVHEDPRLSQRSDDVLAAGNAVTVEPGIYLPGRFGVRIEDLVIVSDDGCEVLSSIGKELTVVE